ncbi:MAG TPA: hypothetical protein VGO92_10095, partial [Acidimicrobiales bacterium]|nr:hypothetical protein [Acidimicrobiales bacterium]
MGRGRWVLPAAAAVVAAAVYGVYLYRALPPPAGDEPHYVLAARSLVEDHDVDLRNDYADVRRWGPVYPAHDRLDHSVAAFDYRGDGTLRSVHNVGLSVLLAPSQALHPGHRSAQAA